MCLNVFFFALVLCVCLPWHAHTRQLQVSGDELRAQLALYMEKFKSIEGTMQASQGMLNDFKKEMTKVRRSLYLFVCLFVVVLIVCLVHRCCVLMYAE